MDFAFDEEQDELRQTVRQALARQFPVAALREFYEASPDGRATEARARWSMLSALGAPGLLVPESAGGLGLSDVDLVGVLEEAGRAALPEPLLETAALAAPMLATLLPAPSAAAALAALLTDDAPLAVGGIDVGVTGPSSPTTVSADGMLRTPRVVGARDAGVYLLAARDPDSGWQLHAVPAEACAVHPTAVLDQARDLSTVQWPLSADTLLAYGVAAEASVGLMADRGAAGSAAYLVGLADRMITLAADYAKERQQFGKPIGSFQAVKHLLAGAQVRLEFARPVVYGAAWSLDGSAPMASSPTAVSRAASTAKAYASDAATEAARVSLQIHGAIGYTWECDLHLFLKRAWALAEAWGSSDDHRSLLLESLLLESLVPDPATQD
jgi:alkylation response protein AidB-like acyl-CoA dehydrogenase